MNICNIIKYKTKTRYKTMLNLNEKKIYLTKSKYEQVNNIVLSSVLNRIDSRFNDVKVIDKDNYKMIIIMPKIERI